MIYYLNLENKVDYEYHTYERSFDIICDHSNTFYADYW
jgi:hypothetical protein